MGRPFRNRKNGVPAGSRKKTSSDKEGEDREAIEKEERNKKIGAPWDARGLQPKGKGRAKMKNALL